MRHGIALSKKLLVLAATIAASAFVSSCGKTNLQKESAFESNSGGGSTPLPTPSPTPTVTASPSPTPSSNPFPLEPVYSFRVRGVGFNPGQAVLEDGTRKDIIVPVGRVLKVQVIPELQDEPVPGYGVYANYSFIGVHVMVGSTQFFTDYLNNGYDQGEPEPSQILPFNNPTTCPLGNTTCRQNIKVTIHRPFSNARCRSFGISCGYYKQYPTHPWNVTVLVQTDDTEALE